jgi:hypothetical protein
VWLSAAHRPDSSRVTINSVGANEFGGTARSGLDGRQESWNQRPEIGKSVRLRVQHNDGDRESNQVLLSCRVHRRKGGCLSGLVTSR